ncbi:LOW QUALITY PROTEIN: mitochondrial protein C2orf69 homolog [Babylonia areolata]|uniref:LOW QUALITY PROTEIN: mitochondrial protein C2orf69 homolog n=1 Tax=Babylonia areolata TaxID=304850 RepID=UPI003FCEFB8D
MKPLHLVCFSTLLLRNSFPQLLRSNSLSYSSRYQPQDVADGLCPQLAGLPWLQYLRFPQCSLHQGPGPYNLCRAESGSMSSSGSHYAQHNVRRLTDLFLISSGDVMDVIVAGQRQEAKERVIFFGGDVQDYPENMLSHRDNGKYVRWNSVSTAGRLCERFPTAMVLVVKPHHMHLKTFSVYSQFVQSNDFGCPTHSSDFGAWKRLVDVYEEAVGLALSPSHDTHSGSDPQSGNSVSSKAGVAENSCGGSEVPQSHSLPSGQNAAADSEETKAEASEGTVVDRRLGQTIPDVPVHLIGFSKGCIVLNQLVHELESEQDNSRIKKFIGQIQSMTWLDGGHSGGSNTWVTDPDAVGHLLPLGISIHVHVTPYQVKDPMRRWIGKEKRRFVELLRKDGAKVADKLHFEDEPRSIENHFRVLEEF